MSQPVNMQAVFKERYKNRNKKSKRRCKKCGSDRVYIVGYSAHCRDCDNWQAAF